MTARLLEEATLARFRAAQRIAHTCVRAVGARLEPGMTERDVARAVRAEVLSAGADGFFHEPLVLTGERSAFRGHRARRDALPSGAVLAAGDAVILDVAPVIDGCAVDVSTTTSLGAHAGVEAGRRLLARLRGAIPGELERAGSGRGLVHAVARLAAEEGFESLQRHYLFGALAHRLFLVPRPGRAALAGLGLKSACGLFGRALASRLPGTRAAWPFWNDTRRAEGPPAHGLWSVEPHLGCAGVGVKWEEILVVDEQGARWLEPELPL